MAKRKKKAKQSKSAPLPDQQADTESAIKKDINQLDSSSFRVFSGLVAIFFLAALLAMNDTTSIWHGAEAWTFWQALSDQPNSWLTTFLHAVYDDGPISIFYLRFFGIFFLLLTGGKFLHGEKTFREEHHLADFTLIGSISVDPQSG